MRYRPYKISAFRLSITNEMMEQKDMVTALIKSEIKAEQHKLSQKGLYGALQHIRFGKNMNDYIQDLQSCVVRFRLYKKPRFIHH